jgi:hypothetical protein
VAPAAGSAPITGAVPAAGPGGPAGPSAAVRRRRLVVAIVGLVLLVLVGVGVAVALHGKAGTPAAAASTVLVPSPSIAPVARSATTPFAAALPSSVLQYALASSTDYPTWVTKGAIEAYEEQYSDGAGGTIGLHVGQWPTADEATTVFTALVTGSAGAGATPDSSGLPRTGQVSIGGQNAGSYSIVNNGDGTGTATWTNGTAVFQLTTTVDEVARAYAAFPS